MTNLLCRLELVDLSQQVRRQQAGVNVCRASSYVCQAVMLQLNRIMTICQHQHGTAAVNCDQRLQSLLCLTQQVRNIKLVCQHQNLSSSGEVWCAGRPSDLPCVKELKEGEGYRVCDVSYKAGTIVGQADDPIGIVPDITAPALGQGLLVFTTMAICLRQHEGKHELRLLAVTS